MTAPHSDTTFVEWRPGQAGRVTHIVVPGAGVAAATDPQVAAAFARCVLDTLRAAS